MNKADHIDYAGDAGEAYQRRVHGVTAQQYLLIAKARAKKLQPFVAASASVLEYGAGNGWNLAELRAKERAAYDVFIDPAIPWREFGIDTYDKVGDLPLHRFDVFFCHHVLEHVERPFDELVSLKKYLAADGRLLLFVPFESRAAYKKYNAADVNGHIFSWNVQSFCRLVEQAGFVVNKYDLLTTGLDRFSARITTRLRLPAGCYYGVRKLLRLARADHEIMVLASVG